MLCLEREVIPTGAVDRASRVIWGDALLSSE